MNVGKIQYNSTRGVYNDTFCGFRAQSRPKVQNSTLPVDCFVYSEENNINKTQEARRNVSFLGASANISRSFETKFTKAFFHKLASEHLPCAYTGIKMISAAECQNLITLQALKKKGSIAIKFLKEYENSMYETEKAIFVMLETESKKHPDLKLQELLQLKYPAAEKALIARQSNVLNKINLMIRDLSKNDFVKVRTVVQEYFDKIFAQNPLPEERFRRKDFLYRLKELDLSDPIKKEKLIAVAEKLPHSESSINAFIVKYSQTYKIRHVNGKICKLPRDSEELGLRLIKPALATEEHIYPQKLYKQEEISRQNGDLEAKKLSNLRVTILTSKYINEEKGDILFDDFVEKSKYNIAENVQNHMNKLTDLVENWMKKGRIDDASLLSDYILVLKEEFARRSSLVNPDISEFEKKLPEMKKCFEEHEIKMQNKKIKKAANADNSHKEQYIDSNGHSLENRKVLKHSSRFSN